jgi:hypothetical protein
MNKHHIVSGLKPTHGLQRAGENGPRRRHGGLPRSAGRQADGALAWQPGPADGDAVGAGRWQGAAGEHRWGPRVAPGRRSGGGAHPSGGSACGGRARCRRRGGGQCWGRRGSGERRGGGREAGKGAAGVMSERRGGITVWGRELGRRCWGSPFFKRGGGGRAQAWRGKGSATGGRGRWRCHATVEGGGVGATRDGAADRWAGTRRGPVDSGWVRGRGSAARHRACETRLSVGAGGKTGRAWASRRRKWTGPSPDAQ